MIARQFNHIGPGQGPGFLVPDLTRQLVALPAGRPLHVGNLDTRRDYTDVRDVAAAYLALAHLRGPSEPVYNVASGVSRSGRDVLLTICATLGRETPELEQDAARIRATDPREIVGNASKLSTATGWAPRIRFEQTIRDAVAASEI